MVPRPSAKSTPAVLLLGPQRPNPSLRAAIDDVVTGDQPVAAITAGWQEYEDDVEELGDLGRPLQNLDLYRRSDLVFAKYPEFRAGLWERKELLDQLHAAYKVQLRGPLESVRALQAMAAEQPETAAPYLADAFKLLQEIDREHCERMAQITAEFDAGQGYGDNPEIARHRDEIQKIVGESGALLIAGGHILVLLNRLRIFAIADLVPQLPVIGWSAGAMALTERVVLFHHFPPQGSNDTAVVAAGLGVAPGIVAFPDARHRLDLGNRERVALLARRFAPARCAALDSGERIRWDGSQWHGTGGARVLENDGSVVEWEK